MPRSNVVITGLGVVSSIGIGADAFFDSLLAKRSGITSLANRTDEGAKPGSEPEPAGLWIGGPIIDFDAKQYVRPRKALKVMCREIQTAFAASQLAIEDAGLEGYLPAHPEGELRPADIGTVFGSEMLYGPPAEIKDAIRDCLCDDGTFQAAAFGAAAMKQILPLWMLKYLPNMPACHVGIAMGAQGPNNTLVLGDVSGPAAMIEAASCLERGIAKVMIAGASGTRINTTRLNYRGDLPIAEVFDPPEQSSRPFDPASRGVIGGEGAAALVMESPAYARQRGAKPIAQVLAHASRFVPCGGMFQPRRSCGIDQPEVRGSADAIRLAITGALDAACMGADDISLVVSHAMGDPLVDAAEQKALLASLPGVAVTAPIALLGHTGAASGTIELVTGALALVNRTVPPALGNLASLSSVGLQSKAGPLRGDHVICLSHTSEGSATAVILGRV